MRVLVEVTMIVALPERTTDLDLGGYPQLVETQAPGNVEYHDVGVTKIVTPADAVCDFCSSPDPVWTYPCRSFTLGVSNISGFAEQGSAGAWAACYPCSRLIEEGEDEDLSLRAISNQSELSSLLPRETQLGLAADLRRIHDKFRQHRTGDRQPITGKAGPGVAQ